MRLKKFAYKKVGSTNNIAIKKINTGFKNGIIVSDMQNKGRGRFSKKWISIKGNLFTTIFYQIENNSSIKQLTKFNKYLITKCLKKYTKHKLQFKFPNDILINNHKICGILQEIITKNKKKYMIVGIGINVVESPNLKDYKTSYINKFLKKRISKEMLFKNLKFIFEKNLREL